MAKTTKPAAPAPAATQPTAAIPVADTGGTTSAAAFFPPTFSRQAPIHLLTGGNDQTAPVKQFYDFRYERIPPQFVLEELARHRIALNSQTGLFRVDVSDRPQGANRQRVSYFSLSWYGEKDPPEGAQFSFGGTPYMMYGDGSISSCLYSRTINWPAAWTQACQTARVITNGIVRRDDAQDPRNHQEMIVCFRDALYPSIRCGETQWTASPLRQFISAQLRAQSCV